MNSVLQKFCSKVASMGVSLFAMDDNRWITVKPNGERRRGRPVLINEKGEVLCVRQYRYTHGRVFLEIPAGKLEIGETDRPAAALRELREETGARCETLTYIGDFIPSPAILGEVISMYIAEGLTMGETDPDDDEFIDVEAIPLDKLAEMCVSGEIKDGKTIAAVLKAKYLLDKRK